MSLHPWSSQTDSISELSLYTRWPEIFRSWFWRFYDHLLRLVFYNLGWFLSLILVAWFVFRFKWFEPSLPLTIGDLLRLLLLYLFLCGISFAWSSQVFKIFIRGQKENPIRGKEKLFYFLKALVLSTLTIFIIGIGYINIHFYFRWGEIPPFFSFTLAVLILWILLFWVASSFYHWPLLLFQNPPLFQIIYKSFLLVLANGPLSLGLLIFFASSFLLFSLLVVPWIFVGLIFFFSFQCVTLEKQLLKYKITYQDIPIETHLKFLERERQKGWRYIFKPWENS